jgi:hypothetical protein
LQSSGTFEEQRTLISMIIHQCRKNICGQGNAVAGRKVGIKQGHFAVAAFVITS